MAVSYVAAGLAGALALLSPLSALSPVSFFASSTGVGAREPGQVGARAGLAAMAMGLWYWRPRERSRG